MSDKNAGPKPFAPSFKAQGLVFVSGQVPSDFQASVKQQTREALAKIAAELSKYGANHQNIVKTTVFLANGEDVKAMNEGFAEFFDGHMPTRSTIVTELVVDAKVEIEAIASLDRT